MSSLQVKKSSLKGSLYLPPSKSHTMRALLFALMAEGTSTIRNYLQSPDTDAMVLAMEKLGAHVTKTKTTIQVRSSEKTPLAEHTTLDCNNSGIMLRFLTAISCLKASKITITGDLSLQTQRPMKPLIKALEELGACFSFENKAGFCPFTIENSVSQNQTTVDGSDSQFVSALLLLGAFSQKGLTLHVTNPGEIPWVSMTLSWLDKFNISYEVNEAYTRYKIYPAKRISGFDYTVPADLSSAAFPIASALITNSDLTLKNIDLSDPQGDKKLIFELQAMGAKIDYDKNSQELKIQKGSKLTGKKIDMNEFVDGICIMAVVACFAKGETILHNAAIVRTKECDRLQAMETELKKMGANISQTADGLKIQTSSLSATSLNGHNDHRVILSLAVAGLGAHGTTHISPSDAISKTYKNFVKDFTKLSAKIKVLP